MPRTASPRSAAAKLQTVNVLVNQTTGTITLKASFPNEQEKLWPGDFVDCRIIVDKRNDGLTVPTARSVHRDPKGDYVWVVTPDNTAAIRPVRVQAIARRHFVDRGRVQEGDNVVLDGYQRLQAGSPGEQLFRRRRTSDRERPVTE